MINLDLTWPESAGMAVVLAAGSAALLRRGQSRPSRPSRPSRSGRAMTGAGRFVREAALFFALFALWQYAGSFALLGADGGARRRLWIWRAKREVPPPTEATLQRLFLPHPLLVP
ncbi:MAG: hypothetical protein ACR2FU_14245, partial [Streptosporangiaceae bacterium]